MAWTQQQDQAIKANGGPLLVTAAAGSGKTSVLTERIVRLITEENIDADRLLVLTFTRAAAAEMRNRIALTLAQKQTEHPENRRIMRQQLLLARANISTVDSFCADLVRENFRTLGVQSDFRILEGREYELFRDDVLSELLEKKYEERENGFLLLDELVSGAKSNEGIRKTVVKMVSFLSTYADREEWLTRMEKENDESGAFFKSLAMKQWQNETEYHICLLEKAIAMLPDDYPKKEENTGLMAGERERLCRLLETMKQNNWEALCEECRKASFDRWISPRNYSAGSVEHAKDLRNNAKSFVLKISAFCCKYTEERLKADNEALKPMLAALISLLREFCVALDAAKREANVLAFDDLELLSVKLLTSRDENGKLCKGENADEIASHFDAVFVDEYQDTNYVQTLLYDLLSDNGKKLFMVGDIKQSIYSFRSAVPEIFENKKENYPLYDEKNPSFPARIALSANFRSRKGITDFVNFVFRRFCTPSLGGTVYDETEQLSAQGKFEKEIKSPCVEFHLCEGEAKKDCCRKTANLVVSRILSLMEEEKGALSYGDIAILVPSVKAAVPFLNEAFEKAHIPLSVDNSDENFFQMREIRLALALLRTVFNPYDEVSLAATLINPCFGFTSDDLARFRLKNRSAPFYEALCEAANEEPRVASFLQTVEELRRIAGEKNADELLLAMYERTSLPAVTAAQKGESAVKNLDALVGYASEYAKNNSGSLSSFLRYIDRLQENGYDLAAANAVASDAVHLMTVHKSKGLEFPVVILPKFSNINRDYINNTSNLTHIRYGFASRVLRDGVRYDTLPFEVLKEELLQENLSEELRLLYVAMTRAVDRLIFIDTDKKLFSAATDLSDVANDIELLHRFPKNVSDIYQWALWALCLHRDGAELCKRGGVLPLFNAREAVEPVAVFFCEEGESEAPPEKKAEAEEPLEAKEAFDLAVFDEAYPFEKQTVLPTKVSASGLSHGETGDMPLRRPSFAQKDKPLSAAERGTAMHLFMCLLDFSSDLPLREYLETLEKKGKITREQAASLDLSACEAFLSSPLGKRVKAAAKRNELRREYAFSFRERAQTLGLNAEENPFVMVNGIADLIFFEEDTAVIVDYKTDAVTSPEELKNRYATQLTLYADAAKSLWEKEKTERILWSFALSKAVEI